MDFRDYIKELVEEIGKEVGADTVFGASREIAGSVVIPVAQVSWGGGGGFGEATEKAEAGTGGGGGLGIQVKPLGAIVVTEGDVRWMPTLDVTRIVMMGCLVAVAAMLVMRSAAASWCGSCTT